MSYNFTSSWMSMPLMPGGGGAMGNINDDPFGAAEEGGGAGAGDAKHGYENSSGGVGVDPSGIVVGLGSSVSFLDDMELFRPLAPAPSGWERCMRWDRLSGAEWIVESSWLRPSRFLAWKALAFVWCASVWLMTLVNEAAPKAKFFVFLTHWNQTTVVLYLGTSLYICARHWRGRKEAHLPELETTRCSSSTYAPSPLLLRFAYVAMEHCFAWSCLVVLIYWSVEFPAYLRKERAAGFGFFLNVCIHAVVLLVVGADLALNRVEFVLQHLAYTLPISLVYLAVNAIYCAVAGGFIYEVLRWDSHVTALAVIACALFIALMYPLGHFICKQRNKISGNQPPPMGKWCSCSRE